MIYTLLAPLSRRLWMRRFVRLRRTLYVTDGQVVCLQRERERESMSPLLCTPLEEDALNDEATQNVDKNSLHINTQNIRKNGGRVRLPLWLFSDGHFAV